MKKEFLYYLAALIDARAQVDFNPKTNRLLVEIRARSDRSVAKEIQSNFGGKVRCSKQGGQLIERYRAYGITAASILSAVSPIISEIGYNRKRSLEIAEILGSWEEANRGRNLVTRRGQPPSAIQLWLFKQLKEVFKVSSLEMEYGIPPYTVDLAIPKRKLVLEVDGAYWHRDKLLEAKRDRYLKKLGWKVYHFDAHERSLPEMLRRIKSQQF